MEIRFGFDMGTNSIGWSVVETDSKGQPKALVDMGVRIFSPTAEAGREAKGGQSLAVKRRIARGMRRRRDRFLRRQDAFMKALIRFGLMPADKPARKELEKLNPNYLRRDAIHGPMPLHHIGRALFHMNQRRGFKSNRKTDSGDQEAGAIRAGVAKTEAEIKARGAATLGEMLAERLDAGEGTRARNVGEATKVDYDFYPDRSQFDDEFRRIWAAQAPHHPELTDTAFETLHGIMFFQRPLKPVNPGRCSLYLDEDRAPKALPLFQRVRILQEVGNLKIQIPGVGQRYLSLQERDLLVADLRSKKNKREFVKMRQAVLKLPDDQRFTIETINRDSLDCDKTATVLGATKTFHKEWARLDLKKQQEVVEFLLESEDEEEVLEWLEEKRFGLSLEQMEAISRASLPAGHGRFGRRALEDLFDVFQNESGDATDPETGEVYRRPLRYDEAVAALGLHHSDRRPEELRRKLPYYGDELIAHVVENHAAGHQSQDRRGRITNPTVHIGLNQLRRVCNALIDKYGAPESIALELARELKQNKKQKDAISKRNAENRRANERRDADIAAAGRQSSRELRMKLRLFEEFGDQPVKCILSGDTINMRRLLEGDDIEIEHILPYSDTLDDSISNLMLSTRAKNREKGKRSPFEAFGAKPEWPEILDRAQSLPEHKRWRFDPDAMTRFDEDGGFLARQLTDTQYMARIAKTYLGLICEHVNVTPGRLTAMLRGKWGLNSVLYSHNQDGPEDDKRSNAEKNRNDHRHHALDAFVIACTTRGMLQRVATAAGNAAEKGAERLIEEMPDPWDGFRNDVQTHANRIVVSHKPDHGRKGQLHEATALGTVRNPEAEGGYNHVHRKSFRDLTDAEIKRIRAPELREAVENHVYEAGAAGVGLKEALADFAESGWRNKVNRVRLLKAESDTIAVRHGPNQEFFKHYTPGNNLFVEIYETLEGTWHGEGISVFQANQVSGHVPEWRTTQPEARLIMRLYKGDMIEMESQGQRGIYIVVRIEPSSKRVRLILNRDAGNFQNRHTDSDDPFRWVFGTWDRLKSGAARKVRVDEIGRVWPADPTS